MPLFCSYFPIWLPVSALIREYAKNKTPPRNMLKKIHTWACAWKVKGYFSETWCSCTCCKNSSCSKQPECHFSRLHLLPLQSALPIEAPFPGPPQPHSTGENTEADKLHDLLKRVQEAKFSLGCSWLLILCSVYNSKVELSVSYTLL